MSVFVFSREKCEMQLVYKCALTDFPTFAMNGWKGWSLSKNSIRLHFRELYKLNPSFLQKAIVDSDIILGADEQVLRILKYKALIKLDNIFYSDEDHDDKGHGSIIELVIWIYDYPRSENISIPHYLFPDQHMIYISPGISPLYSAKPLDYDSCSIELVQPGMTLQIFWHEYRWWSYRLTGFTNADLLRTVVDSLIMNTPEMSDTSSHMREYVHFFTISPVGRRVEEDIIARKNWSGRGLTIQDMIVSDQLGDFKCFLPSENIDSLHLYYLSSVRNARSRPSDENYNHIKNFHFYNRYGKFIPKPMVLQNNITKQYNSSMIREPFQSRTELVQFVSNSCPEHIPGIILHCEKTGKREYILNDKFVYMHEEVRPDITRGCLHLVMLYVTLKYSYHFNLNIDNIRNVMYFVVGKDSHPLAIEGVMHEAQAMHERIISLLNYVSSVYYDVYVKSLRSLNGLERKFKRIFEAIYFYYCSGPGRDLVQDQKDLEYLILVSHVPEAILLRINKNDHGYVLTIDDLWDLCNHFRVTLGSLKSSTKVPEPRK